MDRLELYFGICFSFADLDKYYSVEGLVRKVKERIEKQHGNMIILNERNKEKQNYFPEIFLVIFVMLLCFC
jgi:hypothetical protein